MKESYREGQARHLGPESCAGDREVAGEALTGEDTGRVLSCENRDTGVPTLLTQAEGKTGGGVSGEPPADPAQSETPCTCGHFMRGSREIPQTPVEDGATGRSEKATNQKSDVYICGKSDRPVVPKKPANKDKGAPESAEEAEGRGLTKGNSEQTAAFRTQGRGSASIGLPGVREAARRDKRARFTALLHHVTVKLLGESFYALDRQAAPGADEVTWRQYEVGLEDRLRELHEKVHRGTYRAQPSKRAYIPKADGQMRPLGIAALEDKIVQQAMVTVLSHVYEADFLGFSYGFRTGRGAHDALDALSVGIARRKVNWVLDADIRGFFDTIDHECLMRFLEHRIADRRVLRLVRKWLRAGVSEDGAWFETKVGTPQGAVLSPLLANVYLHYVLDLWVEHWRKHHVTGDIIIVRYADDYVLGFEKREDAERFLKDLQERLKKFGLALHTAKTRLIEFGRHAAENRERQGMGKPETFNFLGFTHICGRTRKGKFIVRRETIAKRMSAKLREVRQVLMRNRHAPVQEHARWLAAVVRGHLNYFAVPGNSDRVDVFRTQCIRVWYRALCRRSQRRRINWKRFGPLANRLIPMAKIQHPHPWVRFDAKHPR